MFVFMLGWTNGWNGPTDLFVPLDELLYLLPEKEEVQLLLGFVLQGEGKAFQVDSPNINVKSKSLLYIFRKLLSFFSNNFPVHK